MCIRKGDKEMVEYPYKICLHLEFVSPFQPAPHKDADQRLKHERIGKDQHLNYVKMSLQMAANTPLYFRRSIVQWHLVVENSLLEQS